MFEALERCLSESGKDAEPIITVRTTDGVVPLPMRSISMVEAKDKVCTISTEDKDWRAYTTLTALEDQLDVRCFVRVQRSFLVNMRHIKTLYHDRVVMKNGEVISLGRGRKQEVRQRYQDFMFALARGELT